MEIGETLQAVRSLKSPVIRSCHIGNNTLNNWAWLDLARNTRMVQFDHTLYGMDEVSAPWLVLSDGGRVEAAYDHRGRTQTQFAGLHANQVIPTVDRSYLSHLNYGIFAHHAGEDLIASHCGISAQLSSQMNNSVIGFDSSELLNERGVISEVVSAFATAGKLDNVFDRWIRTTRRGHIVAEPLRGIEYVSPGTFRFIGMNGEVHFEGGLEPLLSGFFYAMEMISKRLRSGAPFKPKGYPWMKLCFSYLVHVIIEYRHNHEQRIFWHGGGSASSYYINTETLSQEFNDNAEVLEDLGYLPQQASMRFIPTYSCQLCALDGEGLDILASMIDLWSRICCYHQKEITHACLQLEETTKPLEVVEFVARLLKPAESRDLLELLSRFNEIGGHKLPIAHVPERPIHPTYNKYGLAQRNLRGRRLEFPANLYHLRWAEAELLIKILGFYLREHLG
ncbi:MAG TPA: hypothetical protein VFP11_15880 [Candidatus Angelobacter sp.]|nr:hypothetical protein [Candidatus Angelobacter sp.]